MLLRRNFCITILRVYFLPIMHSLDVPPTVFNCFGDFVIISKGYSYFSGYSFGLCHHAHLVDVRMLFVVANTTSECLQALTLLCQCSLWQVGFSCCPMILWCSFTRWTNAMRSKVQLPCTSKNLRKNRSTPS